MTSARHSGVVIIGGGHAGGRTAERLRHGGYVDPIEVVGAELELPYERPPLSKAVLSAAQVPPAYLLPATRWAELNVHFRLGIGASAIDRAAKTVLLASGEKLSYRKLVIATGLQPRRLDALAPVSSSTLYLRSFEDAVKLRGGIAPGTSLLLVGAGLIGLEVAASAVRLGARVTVVEAAERPLSRLMPPRLSDWFHDIHRSAGVRILCGRTVQASGMTGGKPAVTLDDGTELTADLILVGIGGAPNDALARAAGLETANGIVVNEFGQTSAPDIYAVGDVAFHVNPLFGVGWRLESWKNAEDQAGIVASHICGQPVPYREVPWFWTDQFDFNVQVAGVPGQGTPDFERGVLGQRGYLAYFMDGDRLKGAVGIGCGRDIRIARETIKVNGRLTAADLVQKGFEPARKAAALEGVAS